MKKSSNPFIDMITKKQTKSFRHYIRYRSHKRTLKKFRNYVLKGSPDFDFLWTMADFVKLAERIFFYNNTNKDTKENDIGLYSSRKFEDGQNGFRIDTKECTIVIKLYSYDKRIAVELERKNGTHMKSLQTFANGDWESNYNIYDEMLLEQTLKIINGEIIKLFDWCYNKW